jgi:hypothetical protein
VTTVTLAMEEDEAFNPVAIRLLGTDAVVLEANARANEIEQARCRRRIRGNADPLGCDFVSSDDGS